MLLLLLFYILLCVLEVNVGEDFNAALREHDIDLCKPVAGNKRLDHLTKDFCLFGFLKKNLYDANYFPIFSSMFQ